jgi:hypothetical protein
MVVRFGPHKIKTLNHRLIYLSAPTPEDLLALLLTIHSWELKSQIIQCTPTPEDHSVLILNAHSWDLHALLFLVISLSIHVACTVDSSPDSHGLLSFLHVALVSSDSHGLSIHSVHSLHGLLSIVVSTATDSRLLRLWHSCALCGL